jgi:hypothetical protein
MYRLLTHPDLTVTKHELECHWCLDDVLEAHEVLDALDEARVKSRFRNG